MLRTKIVAAALLTAALSLVAMPESFARGGFGGHWGGARIGGTGARSFVGGIRPIGVRPFIGPRIAFHHPHHRRFFPIFPLAFRAGLAYRTYPYCAPLYSPSHYNT